MKHFELKNFLGGAGGGGGKKPKPAKLEPPYLGEYKNIASYSYSEVIDLISDGPVEGLTDKKGFLLDQKSYLQGVYLNNVPVEVSSDKTRAVTQVSGDSQILIRDNLISGVIRDDVFGKLNQDTYSRRSTHVGAKTLSEVFVDYSRNSDGDSYITNTYSKNLNYQDFLNIDTSFDGLVDNQFKFPYSGLNNYSGSAYARSRGSYTTLVDYENIYNYRTDYREGGGGFFNSTYNYVNINEVNGQDFIKNTNPNWHKSNDNYYFEFKYRANNSSERSENLFSFFLEPTKGGIPNGEPEILTPSSSFYSAKLNEQIDNMIETMGLSTSRFEKELIKEKFFDIGIDLGERDENFSYDINKQEITSLLEVVSEKFYQQTIIERSYFGRYKARSALSNTTAPYFLFCVENEDNIVDGYNQTLHEDLFLNPKYGSIPIYDENVVYELGDIYVFDGKYYQVTGLPSETTEIILDQPEVNWTKAFLFKSAFDKPNFNVDVEWDFIIPQLDNNGKWNGKIKGFNIQFLKSSVYTPDAERYRDHYGCLIALDNKYMDYYTNLEGLTIAEKISQRSNSILANKYNYSNVLMEFRPGNENQTPLGFFKHINIDHFYEDQLIGPFSTNQINPFLYNYDIEEDGVQKLKPGTDLTKTNSSPRLNFDNNSIPDMDPNFLIAYEETSVDERNTVNTPKNYSNWDNSKNFNESAQPITHIIQNPNVKSCFISLWVKQLMDTFEEKLSAKADIGSRKPSVINIRVEVGLLTKDGKQEKFNDRFFQIIALIESPTLIDIGSPDSETSAEFYEDVREVPPFNSSDSPNLINQEGLYTPFLLPEITQTTETDTEFKEDNSVKRYIKITKLSTETESSLVRKDVDLLKVTEIIESTCRYPLSSLVGIKTDSRVFGEIPERSYKCKLKKIKIPSNYKPILENGKDKRYYDKETDLSSTILENKLVYNGDWDGLFEIGWTDNPAWILYDMLTSPRYGLGDQIEEDQVNKWDLYKIGRFCDAVDEDGYFVGVSDARGGLEPRFSCNIMFSKGINVFDAINSISAIFRGIVYFDDSSISFSDDRLKEPIALFTNSNVQDGFFAYSSSRRDEKYNAVEVSYKDKNDGYKSKIEYVENEDDIANRGLFKKEIIAVGITSKAMAIRAAKHVMYQTTKEDETISFSTSTEALLCKPGDLILVEDELKTLNTNFGRVLDIDHVNGIIRTSETFNASDYNTKITLYVPSGNKTREELESQASQERVRLSNFKILGNTSEAGFDDNFYGEYRFSRYSKGYDKNQSGNFDDSLSGYTPYESYAVYTGDNISAPIIWFDIQSTGWVFSTGESFTNDDTYNKYITSGSIFSFKTLSNPVLDIDINQSSGWLYDSAQSDNRSTAEFSFSGVFKSDFDYFGGLLEEEIEISSTEQVRGFNVTGWGGYQGIQAKEYGDIIYIDENDVNYNLLEFVPEGTTYRFESQKYNDQVYKIQSIREEENRSYNIVANKYDSGKFSIIENEVNIEREEDVFGYNQLQYNVEDITYIKLNTPTFQTQETGLSGDVYQISLSWDDIESSTGYNLIYEGPGGASQNLNLEENEYVVNTDGSFGVYSARIRALANPFNNNDYNSRYSNSEYSSTLIEAGDANQIIQETAQPEGGGIE